MNVLTYVDNAVRFSDTHPSGRVRIVVDGVVVWEAPKPKVRVHPYRIVEGVSARFVREDGDYDLYARDTKPYGEYLMYFPAEYA